MDVITYYLWNQDVVDVADEMLAFQVNASRGTQDTVDMGPVEGDTGRIIHISYRVKTQLQGVAVWAAATSA